MSQFETGLEEIGLGSGQANSLYNANLQRLNWLLFMDSAFHFPAPTDGLVSAPDTRDYDRVVKFVALQAHDALALPLATVTTRLRVNGGTVTQNFTLLAGETFRKTAVVGNGNGGANPFPTLGGDPFSGPGVLVGAGQSLQVEIVSASGVGFLTATVIWRNRKL